MAKDQTNYLEGEDMTPEQIAELKKESAQAEAKIKTPAPKMFTEEDVAKMVERVKAELTKDNDVTKDDEIDGERKNTVRLPRWDKKFIVAFKNLNDDPFFPDRVVYAKDVFNSETKQFVPHVTFIMDDGSDITMPFETMLKVADKRTQCQIVERVTKDVSQKYGTLEVKELKEGQWNEASTGTFVQGKTKITHVDFIVKLPDGRDVLVSPEVINW